VQKLLLGNIGPNIIREPPHICAFQNPDHSTGSRLSCKAHPLNGTFKYAESYPVSRKRARTMYEDSWYSFVPEIPKQRASGAHGAGHQRRESLLQQPNVSLLWLKNMYP
jgi:hypothetical protein